MSIDKCTPGKWEVNYDNSNNMQWYEVGPAVIQYSYNSSIEDENEVIANAKLIAASKDMYEALVMIKKMTENQAIRIAIINALPKL